MQPFKFLQLTVTDSENLPGLPGFSDKGLDLGVALQKTHPQVTGTEVLVDGLVAFESVLDSRKSPLKVLAEFDMDVSDNRILSLIYLDNGVKQFFYALSGTADSGNDRNTDHIPQSLIIKHCAGIPQFIVHIQGNDHRVVHVDQFCRQVEVALQVGGVHDIDNHIRIVVFQIGPDIPFLGGIGRKGVGSRQVYDIERIASMHERSRLGIDGDSRIIAYVFFGAGSHIEQRGFSAIGIAY